MADFVPETNSGSTVDIFVSAERHCQEVQCGQLRQQPLPSQRRFVLRLLYDEKLKLDYLPPLTLASQLNYAEQDEQTR